MTVLQDLDHTSPFFEKLKNLSHADLGDQSQYKALEKKMQHQKHELMTQESRLERMAFHSAGSEKEQDASSLSDMEMVGGVVFVVGILLLAMIAYALRMKQKRRTENEEERQMLKELLEHDHMDYAAM